MSIEDRAERLHESLFRTTRDSYSGTLVAVFEEEHSKITSALLAERMLALEEALEVIKHYVICDWKNNKYEKDFEDIKECFSFAIRKLMEV